MYAHDRGDILILNSVVIKEGCLAGVEIAFDGFPAVLGEPLCGFFLILTVSDKDFADIFAVSLFGMRARSRSCRRSHTDGQRTGKHD